MEVVTSLVIALSIPLLLYVILIGVFAFVAAFSTKHQKQAAKVLDSLVKVRIRGR